MSYMRGDLLTVTRKLVKGLAISEPAWLKAMEQAPPVVFPHTNRKVKEKVLPEDVYVRKFFKKHPSALQGEAVKETTATTSKDLLLTSAGSLTTPIKETTATTSKDPLLTSAGSLTAPLKETTATTSKNPLLTSPGSLTTPSKLSGFDPSSPACVFARRVLELKEQGADEDVAMAIADMEYMAEKKAKMKAYRELKQICLSEGRSPPPRPYPKVKKIQTEENFPDSRFFNRSFLRF